MSRSTIMPYGSVLRGVARLLMLGFVLVWIAWAASGWYWFSANFGNTSVLLGGGRVLVGTGSYSAPYGPFPSDGLTCGKRSGYCPTWAYWEYFLVKDTATPARYGSASLTPLGIGLPFVAIGLWFLGRWRKRWACSKCGYDLRGLRSTTCPECGKAFSSPRLGAKPPSST